MLFSSPNNCVQRNFLSSRGAKGGRLFLQIGAGAGDRDPRTNFKDGFTNYVKRVGPTARDRVILVEPNPGNVHRLKECWQGIDCAEIISVAVLPSGEKAGELKLWFAQEDAPHFQVCSHDKSHVERHYPQGTIESISVPAIPIDDLFSQIGRDLSFELLGIDVEGMDADILLSIDWSANDIHAVSFESVHMGADEDVVRQKLLRAGYVSAGVGLDIHGLDSLVIKPDTPLLRFRARLWELERQANLADVNGNPWKSMLYLINWFRTRNLD